MRFNAHSLRVENVKSPEQLGSKMDNIGMETTWARQNYNIRRKS
jgi:hypothetical protein